MTRGSVWLGVYCLGTLCLGAAGAVPLGVGVIVPLSGPAQSIGEAIGNGANLCFQNARETLPSGFELSVRTVDDKSNTDEVKRLLAGFVAQDEVRALLTGSVSGVSFALTETLRSSPMATVGALSVANVFTDRALPFVSRVSTRSDILGRAGVQFAAQALGVKSALTLDDASVYGKDLTASMAQELLAQKVSVLERISTPETQNFDALVARIVALKPQAVLMGFNNYTVGGAVVRALRAAGFDGVILGGNSFSEKSFADAAGDGATNLYFVAGFGPAAAYSSALNKNFFESYRTRYKLEPTAYALLGCDAAQTIVQALALAVEQKGGAVPSRADVIRALRRVTFNGQTGRLSFNRLGDRRQNSVFVMQYGKDGQARVIELRQVRGTP